jgi:hypothetical protein
MKTILLALTILTTSAAVGAERWQSPDAFYSIAPPDQWRFSEFKAPHGSRSYAFGSPDGASVIRISAAYNLDLPEVLPDRLLERAFPDERGLAPMKTIQGKEWDGLRREYVDADGTKHWIGIVARNGSTAVLLTLQAPEKEFERYRSLLEKTASSLELGKPK